MSAVQLDSSRNIIDAPGNQKQAIENLFYLRSELILEHPLILIVGENPKKLFQMFELYANFVYDFTEYVTRLFMSLRDEDIKRVMFENLVDEIGVTVGTETSWKAQHGEMYRQFIESLRSTKQYQDSQIKNQICAIETASKKISKSFYGAHHAIIEDRDDLQSFSAFSTIECWVNKLYTFWKVSLEQVITPLDCLDMRTIELHCVCDVAHSAALDHLLMEKIGIGDGTLHSVRRGIVRGITASEQLFSDIQREIT